MTLNISEEMIRDHFSNVQMAVMGEQTLLERLLPVLTQWENWLVENMLPWTLLQQEDIAPLCADVVIYGALRDALPMLDVVLTPNGIATVGNNNLVPASTARSESARKSLALLLFNAQDILLAKLKTIPSWCLSQYGINFAQSLFNSLKDLCNLNKDKEENSYDLAMVMQQMAFQRENRLARSFVLYPLMAHLRNMALANSLTGPEKFVVDSVKNAVFYMVRNNDPRCGDEMMIDVVDYIRKRPEDFPLWHSSSTAQLYEDHSFQNVSSAGGFFFR